MPLLDPLGRPVHAHHQLHLEVAIRRPLGNRERVVLVEDGAFGLEEKQGFGGHGVAELRCVLGIIPSDADDFHGAKVGKDTAWGGQINPEGAGSRRGGRKRRPIPAGSPRNGPRLPGPGTPRARAGSSARSAPDAQFHVGVGAAAGVAVSGREHPQAGPGGHPFHQRVEAVLGAEPQGRRPFGKLRGERFGQAIGKNRAPKGVHPDRPSSCRRTATGKAGRCPLSDSTRRISSWMEASNARRASPSVPDGRLGLSPPPVPEATKAIEAAVVAGIAATEVRRWLGRKGSLPPAGPANPGRGRTGPAHRRRASIGVHTHVHGHQQHRVLGGPLHRVVPPIGFRPARGTGSTRMPSSASRASDTRGENCRNSASPLRSNRARRRARHPHGPEQSARRRAQTDLIAVERQLRLKAGLEDLHDQRFILLHGHVRPTLTHAFQPQDGKHTRAKAILGKPERWRDMAPKFNSLRNPNPHRRRSHRSLSRPRSTIQTVWARIWKSRLSDMFSM